ncbi:uncharacterized protein LOC107647450 [Arachis ipaensis]|uniref:uncharacterized protein LOC107647450 n=1 Tax=Arachis ipaensis TaxID=130454 RepID=UPI0007AF91F6|nr:uncharacterized protein LOC107647450 [Arachis ipaensis]
MVKEIKRKHRLDMLGLVETKRQLVTRFDVSKIWGSGSAGWEYVESDGVSGGLLLIWDDGVLSEMSVNCAFFLVYGAHTRDEKRVVWEELSYMAGLCPSACCFLGDFNEIGQVEERRGLDSLPLSAQDYKVWVHDMGLVDLPISDRFLRMVKEEWRGMGEIQFTDKLKALTVPLGRWHRDNFGDMDKKILKFEEEIQKIDDMVGNGNYDETVEARRKALVKCCEKWYVRKELHWKQMSRSRLAKDMDKNTRYFHN